MWSLSLFIVVAPEFAKFVGAVQKQKNHEKDYPVRSEELWERGDDIMVDCSLGENGVG
jgi:hypothetical protein